MSDAATPPADLVELRVRFLRLSGDISAYARTLPSSVDYVNGTGPGLGDEQRAEWDRLWEERNQVVHAIHDHPWLAPDAAPKYARELLEAAVREHMAGA